MSEEEEGGTIVEVHHTGVLTARNVRLLVIALAVFAMIIVWGGIKLINLTDQIQTTQRVNHASRIKDQKRTDKEIAQLACVIVSQTDENNPKAKLTPEQRAAVRQFRAFYGCPPYSKANAKHPLQQASPSRSSPAQPHESGGAGSRPKATAGNSPEGGDKPVRASGRTRPVKPVKPSPSPAPSRVTVTATPPAQPAQPAPPALLPIPNCTIQVGRLRVC